MCIQNDVDLVHYTFVLNLDLQKHKKSILNFEHELVYLDYDCDRVDVNN